MGGIVSPLLEVPQWGFIEPDILWAALPVAVVVLLGVLYGLNRQTRAAQILGIPEHTSPATVTIAALVVPVCLVVSLARPYWGSEDIDVKASGLEYMFVVDVSYSMLANDLSPTRIDFAKRKIRDIIAGFRERGVTNRYGITLFAGESYPFCPLTSDLGALQQFITWIHPELITSHGSNLSAGVATALERFTNESITAGRVLLISDGEDDKLEVERVARKVAASGIPFDVLGIGTQRGGKIRLGRANLEDRLGNEVVSRLNEDSLRAIAASGGGIYVRAQLGDSDVAQLIQSARGTAVANDGSQQKLRIYREVGPLVVALGLLGMLFIRIGARRSSLIAAFALITLILPQHASADDAGRAAYELYKKGSWKESVPLFREGLRQDPENRALKQGLASALFQSGRLQEAETLFSELATSAQDGHSYVTNQYNLANTLLKAERFDEAIEAYDKALKVNPSDERILHNKHIAGLQRVLKKKKEEEARTQQRQGQERRNEGAQDAGAQSDTGSNDQERQKKKDDTGKNEDSEKPQDDRSPSGDRDTEKSDPPSSSASDRERELHQTPIPTPEGDSKSDRSDDKESPPKGATSDEEGEKSADASAQQDPSAAPGAPDPTQELTGEQRKPLGLSEAEAWLESLPDAPARIVQLQGRTYSEEQPW